MPVWVQTTGGTKVLLKFLEKGAQLCHPFELIPAVRIAAVYVAASSPAESSDFLLCQILQHVSAVF